MKTIIAAFTLALGLLATQAYTPLYEPFAYIVGDPLIGQMHSPSYTWLGPSPAPPNQPHITAGNLHRGGLALPIPERVVMHGGGAEVTATLPFASDPWDGGGGDNKDYPVLTGSAFFSLLLRITDLGDLDANGDFFAALTPFVDAASAPVSGALGFTRVFLRDAGGGTFNIGMSKASSAPASIAWYGTAFVTNTTILIVGDYRFRAAPLPDMAHLWINPPYYTFCTSPPAPDLTSIAGPDAPDIGSFTYYQRSNLDTPGTLLTDELRLGVIWTDVLEPGVDYGDADPAFPVTYAEDGARHFLVPGMYLGDGVDADCDGVETAAADGDDVADGNDDEDGVTYPSVFIRNKTETIEVVASTNGVLDLWIDWNRDGAWSPADPNERVFTAEPLNPGVNTLSVAVPLFSTPGTAHARFRYSESGVATPTGLSMNGEVEDYAFEISIFQLAPADLVLSGDRAVLNFLEDGPSEMSVTVANHGPNVASQIQFDAILPEHVQLQWIGLRPVEAGSCEVLDNHIVCHLNDLNPQESLLIVITMIAAAESLPGDESAMLDDLMVSVTSSENDLHPEDNYLGFPGEVIFLQDWGDAPEGYAVTSAENGAHHRKYRSLRLGTSWDFEGDGMHSPWANYDDNNGVAADDEDGVSFVATTGTITIDVTVTGDGYVDAWFDFNRDLDWNDKDEQVLFSEHLSSETKRFFITVPPGITAGEFISRWRVSETGGLSPRNKGGRGEVEDYKILWRPENLSMSFAGLNHTAHGQAMIATSSEGLQISQLNSTNDRVTIELGRSQGWGASRLSPTQEVARVVYSINIVGVKDGDPRPLTSSLTLQKDGSRLALSVDYAGLGTDGYVARFYGSDGTLLASTAETLASTRMDIEDCDQGETRWCWVGTRTTPWGQRYVVIFCRCIKIAGPLGPISDVSVIEISPGATAQNPDYLTSVEISGANNSSIVLTDESIRQFDLWHRIKAGSVTPNDQGQIVVAGDNTTSEGTRIETILGGPEYIGELDSGNLLRQRVVKEFSPNSFTLPGLGKLTLNGQMAGTTSVQTLSELTLAAPPQVTAAESTVQLAADFTALGATEVKVELFTESELTASMILPMGELGTLNSAGSLNAVGAEVNELTLAWTVDGPPFHFQPANGSTALTGDCLRIAAHNPSLQVEGLSSLETAARSGSPLMIQNVLTRLPRAPRLVIRPLSDEGKVAITLLNTERDSFYHLEAKESLHQPLWRPMRLIRGTGLPITVVDSTTGSRMTYYRLRRD